MRGEGLAAGGVGGGRGRVWYGDPGVGQWGRADEGFAGGESLEWTCREQGEREDEREKADECEDWRVKRGREGERKTERGGERDECEDWRVKREREGEEGREKDRERERKGER